eukprot:Ihof_evm1s750 gene=Ihof_evmTU1s750
MERSRSFVDFAYLERSPLKRPTLEHSPSATLLTALPRFNGRSSESRSWPALNQAKFKTPRTVVLYWRNIKIKVTKWLQGSPGYNWRTLSRVAYGLVLLLMIWTLAQWRTYGQNGSPLPSFPNTVFVGHKGSDVDSACSAYAASQLFGGIPSISPPPHPRDVAYIWDKLHLPPLVPSNDPSLFGYDWFMVDHNQVDKIPLGADPDRVVGIIDHHQLLGNPYVMHTPRMIIIQPWGSTCTVFTFLFQQYNQPIKKSVADCLLAGIISDTLNLKGPTTTEADKKAIKILQPISTLGDYDRFALDMFHHKSDMAAILEEDIVRSDVKRYLHAPDIRFAFSVTETIDPMSLVSRKDKIVKALQQLKTEEHLDLIFFAIVDIISLQSFFLVAPGPERKIYMQ